MMAMSLYGGDRFGPGAHNPASPYHHPNHPYGHGGKLATNHLEAGARSLPRPRKTRKKRTKEVSLYPSIAAVEEAVPEAIVNIHPDSGTMDIRLPGEDQDDSDNEENMETEKEEQPVYKNHRHPRRRRSNSSSSGSTKQLNQEFKKLSVKRKPVASAPWPIDFEDDPLGAGSSLLTPRRKVSRHDSQRSRGSMASSSLSSGDGSVLSGESSASSTASGPTSRRHRRTATYDSLPEDAEGLSLLLHTTIKKKPPPPTSSSALDGKKKKEAPPVTDYLKKKAPPAAYSLTKSKKTTGGSALQGAGTTLKKKPIRRMKSWHDDEQSAQRRAQELEIEPGIFLPLRGSDETLKAIQTGFVEEIFCQACDVELICIADASFCVCPDCKCVSPVDGIASLSNTNKSAGSVGLGLRASMAYHRR